MKKITDLPMYMYVITYNNHQHCVRLTSSLVLMKSTEKAQCNICNNVASNDEGTTEQIQVKEHLEKLPA